MRGKKNVGIRPACRDAPTQHLVKGYTPVLLGPAAGLTLRNSHDPHAKIHLLIVKSRCFYMSIDAMGVLCKCLIGGRSTDSWNVLPGIRVLTVRVCLFGLHPHSFRKSLGLLLRGTLVNRTYGIHKTYIFDHFY